MATLQFVQAQPFKLSGSGSSIGDTAVTLQSMVGIDGALITTSNIGITGFGTLEPGNGAQEEAVEFTGVTQNANGTATLTGVSTVMFKSPYTATPGLAKTHAGNTTFILSNDAAFYAAILQYVDNSISSGGIPATNLVAGISTLSVAAATANLPITIGTNDPRIPTATATSINSGVVAALAGTSGTPASGNRYVTQADPSNWYVLTETVLGSANNAISATFSGRSDIRMVLDCPGASTNITTCILRINSDSGNNYAYKYSLNRATFAIASGTSSILVQNFSNANAFRADFWSTNTSGTPKLLNGTVMEVANTATDVPGLIEQFATWNNTTSQITTVTLTLDSAKTFNAGTRLTVYGSN